MHVARKVSSDCMMLSLMTWTQPNGGNRPTVYTLLALSQHAVCKLEQLQATRRDRCGAKSHESILLSFSYDCCCLCWSPAQLPRLEVRQLCNLEAWRVQAGRTLVTIAWRMHTHVKWLGLGGGIPAAAAGGNTACGSGLNGCGCAYGCNPCGSCGSCGCFLGRIGCRVDNWGRTFGKIKNKSFNPVAARYASRQIHRCE